MKYGAKKYYALIRADLSRHRASTSREDKVAIVRGENPERSTTRALKLIDARDIARS
ncbi:MAG: hypothetical protein ACE5OY_03825 [Candidatus Bathyarchaeia archaeon]